jgi:SHS2 domain-containing protein
MKKFEQIDHPSDIGIIAYGKTPAELFENAALGMFSLTADLSKVKARTEIKIEAKGEDRESLLVNWLNELLFVSDSKKLVLADFSVSDLKENSLQAKCKGENIDVKRHQISRSIKAATYNQLEIKEEKGILFTRVIFDV